MHFAILLVLVMAPACFSANTIRLVGDRLGTGRVEVYHEGEWGTVCGKEGWTLEDAMVVCQQLGFKKAIYESRKAMNGQGTGNVRLGGVHCTGKEHSLLSCPHDGWGNVGDCGHDEDVGVGCINEDLPEMTYKGCFVDKAYERTMPDNYESFRGKLDWKNLRYTAVKCASKANEKGYTYYGLQYFGECYGASGTPAYGKYGEAKPTSCPNGAGMKTLNAVYMLSPWKDLGCWKDTQGSRTMTMIANYRGNVDWNNMDAIVSNCYGTTKAAGKKFFAIQFYGECWASDDDSYKKHGQATNCWKGVGAQWSNYVYEVVS